MQALQIAQNSYVFSSYNVVNWLSDHNTLTNRKDHWTSHSYTSRSDNDDLIIMGELLPDFEIRLSYW